MDDKEIMRTFSEKMVSLRKSKGMTQEKVAESSAISSSYYSQIEKGEKNISLCTLYRLLQTYDTNLNHIFPEMDAGKDKIEITLRKRLSETQLSSLSKLIDFVLDELIN